MYNYIVKIYKYIYLKIKTFELLELAVYSQYVNSVTISIVMGKNSS